MQKIRVVIADNHPTFREGLSRLISEEEIEVVGQAADGDEVVILAKNLKPDVAILDVSMPKLNGIEATKLIKENTPQTAVLMVSAFNNQNYVVASLRAGASGYLTKDTPIRELVNAVHLAHAGDNVIDRKASNDIIRNLIANKDNKKGHLDLYPREMEVLKLTSNGMRNKEIAKELRISERTVQAHLSNIFSKLEVNSRTEAVLQALKQGMLDIGDLSRLS